MYMITDKNQIFEIVSEWNNWEKDVDSGILREEYLRELNRLINSEQVVVVTGVRRSGKSFILRQFAKKLAEKGVDKKDIIYVNFEDVRLGIENVKEWEEIYQLILGYLGISNNKKWLLLDEIQVVDGWEKWVRTMAELQKSKIIITGSNSGLLSPQLGEKLTGRHLDMTVYPLSFSEFTKFNSNLNANLSLRNYFERGGFPLPVLQPQLASEMLLSYFTDIIERDIVKRYRIRNKAKLLSVAKFVMGNYSSLNSYTRIAKYLELAPDTVREYLSYLEEVFLAYEVKIHSFKPKMIEKSPRKIYAIDMGMANIVGLRNSQNIGRLAENAVYIELLRRGLKVSYWKDELHREVDFVVSNNKETKAIQVSWNLNDPKTKAREVKSLVRGLSDLGLKKGIILTEDIEKDEIVNGKLIKYQKLADWLLNTSV